ncbi:MAG: hypothetical protein JO209_01575, partial [Acidisphaera sp.]|nr:hypothetical protein [Acidisphaera sp.]
MRRTSRLLAGLAALALLLAPALADARAGSGLSMGSRGAAGFMIRDGALAEPVAEI